jgi:nitrate/nitrite transporter NarK
MAASGLALLLRGGLAARARSRGRDRSDDASGRDSGASEHDLDARAAIRTRSFWILAAGLVGFWAYLYAMLQHFPLALGRRRGPARPRHAHWANAVFMGMFSKIAFGWIADRVAAKTSLLLDYGLLALSSLLCSACRRVRRRSGGSCSRSASRMPRATW